MFALLRGRSLCAVLGEAEGRRLINVDAGNYQLMLLSLGTRFGFLEHHRCFCSAVVLKLIKPNNYGNGTHTELELHCTARVFRLLVARSQRLDHISFYQ